MEVELFKMTEEHWLEVSCIYQEGINTGNATFELSCPSWENWDKSHRKDCRFVVLEDEKVIGWSALSGISERCVYGGVCEVSVYVAKNSRGKGIGKLLLKALVEQSEKNGIWTLQAGIFPENVGSIELHKKMGFREVGFREKLGELNGVWRNVVLLEKRSSLISF